LAERGVNILSVITAQTVINLLIAESDARVALTALKTIRRGVIACVELETDLALVAAVGEGITAAKGLAGRMFTAVSDAGVNVEMIFSGASPVATYFLVRKADALPSVRALHAEFFETAREPTRQMK
jgi:aspartate kinase